MAEQGDHSVPLISVVMPVHNARAHVGEAIQSILAQTFTAFELIIIDDGSTDGSEAVIRSFTDPRIRYFRQENQGLALALDRGIGEARTALIARHDHDDIAHPHRLTEQFTYMSDHPEVGLLGTWATRISAHGEPIGALEHALDHESIVYHSLFDSPFVHPSVIFRKELYVKAGPYDPAPEIFEDLDMWHRMLRITTGANLPMHLVLYRDVATSMSNTATRRNAQLANCRRRNLLHHFPDIRPNELEVLAQLGIDHPVITPKDLLAVHARLDIFIENNVKALQLRRILRRDLFHKLMSYRLVPHRTIFHRTLDKAWKITILKFSTSPLE